ncbi:MAG TPA: thioredoxin family protein, partial [Acidimicrobiia bacterium]
MPGAPELLAHLPDGLIAVVKRDCPTCTMVAPVLRELADAGALVAVFSQDDPGFPDGLGSLAVTDDRELDMSFALDIDTVPTLLLWSAGLEAARTVGWSRPQWESVAGIDGLGADLPDLRPGCGSRTHDPEIADQRAVAQMLPKLRSRRLDLGAGEDEMEALFARGFTDGLPVVPPTPKRVARMLGGTTRDPHDIVATV